MSGGGERKQQQWEHARTGFIQGQLVHLAFDNDQVGSFDDVVVAVQDLRARRNALTNCD